MEVLPVTPNEAHVMADALHIVSDENGIDSAGTNLESAVSNDD